MLKVLFGVAMAAILLGSVIMLLPLVLLAPAYTRTRLSGIPKPPEPKRPELLGNLTETKGLAPNVCPLETEQKLETYGAAIISPSSVLFAGLTLMFSLFFALGISLYFKRRIA
ncbi:MAG: hypothetical protein AOA65_0930 [Candidatus Bathyarchaeota archaeon BA1]|nr:MAG: hypothetical protein AOA65_0930 [Candidatus Bathyarchaeota archaeon BA1]